MSPRRLLYQSGALTLVLTFVVVTASAGNGNNNCKDLPGYSALKAALVAATATETSGLNNQMWATVVDRDGVVCAVAFSGVNRGAQWPGSRSAGLDRNRSGHGSRSGARRKHHIGE